MSTLKECVESGRRWRLGPNMSNGKTSPWLGPGIANNFDADLRILVSDAVASDFEIEPEPEKPREWTLHVPLPGSKYESNPNILRGARRLPATSLLRAADAFTASHSLTRSASTMLTNATGCTRMKSAAREWMGIYAPCSRIILVSTRLAAAR